MINNKIMDFHNHKQLKSNFEYLLQVSFWY